jgi:L-ascorbate metabolism protein UlaG (beta-lactamase superfamily)
MGESSSTKVVITLVGGPTALIEVGGVTLLTDPTFDEPQAYQGAAVTLVKSTGPSLRPEQLPAIDAVLLSHDQHFDNLDHGGRAFLPQVPRVLTTQVGAGRLGGNAEGLATWDSTLVRSNTNGTLTVTAVPARHGPAGIEPLAGDVAGFVVTPEGAGGSIYISGDTVWYDGVAAISQRFDIKLAVLFTGAARPRGAFHMTMGSNDAIDFAHAFPTATIVAVHNEGWMHFTESQAELARSFATVGIGDRLRHLERGAPLTLEY